MGLPPLATPADAARLGYSLPPESAGQWLARASTRLRRFAGHPITRTVSTVALTVQQGRVRLPSPLVVSVDRVEADPGGGRAVALTAAGGVRACSSGAVALGDWWWDEPWLVFDRAVYARVLVTYTHGLAVLPEELVDLTCQVGARLAATPAGMEVGVRQQSIDNYSVTYASEQVTTSAGLLAGEQAALAGLVPITSVWMLEMR